MVEDEYSTAPPVYHQAVLRVHVLLQHAVTCPSPRGTNLRPLTALWIDDQPKTICIHLELSQWLMCAEVAPAPQKIAARRPTHNPSQSSGYGCGSPGDPTVGHQTATEWVKLSQPTRFLRLRVF